MKKNVLVISVHPDDETLGCGGTLLKHKNCGDNLNWLIITNVNNEKIWGKEFISKRQIEIKKVSESYGFTETIKLKTRNNNTKKDITTIKLIFFAFFI